MSGSPDEYSRLRRAAFRRGATAEDLQALRDFEARVPDEPVEPAEPEASEPASDAAAADSPPGPTGTEQKSAGSRPFRGAALVAAGLLVGLVVGLALAPVLRPASSLEVFDTTEPPETLPAVAEMLHQIWDSREDAPYRTLLYDVRALGVIEGKEIYGGLAARVYPDGSGAREVCLLMQRVGTDPGGTATCVLREDFMKHGVDLALEKVWVQWGPFGEPTRIEPN